MRLLSIGFVLAAALTAKAGASDETFEYRISHLVKPPGFDCSKFSGAVAAKFHAVTKNDILNAACVEENNGQATVSISYLAKTPASRHSAYLGVFPSASQVPALSEVYGGIYSTTTDCYRAVSTEAVRFAELTGLPVVAAVCFKAFAGGYAGRIDGFGSPKMRFINSGYSLGFAGDPDAAFAKKVSELLSNQGAKPIYVVPFGHSLSAMYYTSDEEEIAAHAVRGAGVFDSKPACDEQLDSLSKIFSSLGAPNHVRDCLADGSPKRLGMAFVFAKKGFKYLTKAVASYGSYDQCLSERERVLGLAKDKLKWPAAGAICVPDASSNGFFRMMLIGKSR